MQFIEFRDHCTIKRQTGEKDEWDNLVRQTVYEGDCNYQEGGASYSRVFTTRNPVVFLPSDGVLVQINDAIEIVTEFGREIKSVVKIVRDIKLPGRANAKVTRIELKQTQGD